VSWSLRFSEPIELLTPVIYQLSRDNPVCAFTGTPAHIRQPGGIRV
jgi:hypothetical protein